VAADEGSPRGALRVPAAGAIGQLRADEGEHMTLHTRDALSLFAGRSPSEGSALPAIVGGRRFAAAMRSLWLLSGADNPYADWALLRADAALKGASDHMAEVGAAHEVELSRLRERGLSCRVLTSERPAVVSLGFASPYGFATAEAIVEFDHHVRRIRTLVLRNRMSDEQGRLAVREAGRRLRALFQEPMRWERVLLREELKPLTRSDFLPGADQPARGRVIAVQNALGLLPRDVLTGARVPRHTRRRVRVDGRAGGNGSQPGASASGPQVESHDAMADENDEEGLGSVVSDDIPELTGSTDPFARTNASDSPHSVDPFDPFYPLGEFELKARLKDGVQWPAPTVA
jgi:integrating conjugative element protein (TIGR03761 family)